MFRPGPNQPPTGTDALRRGTAALRAAGIAEPAFEAELLLRHVTGLDRAALFLRLPQPLTGDDHRGFLKLLGERASHKPSAYITGHREFYGLEFHVEPGVLIPRPETEMVVEQCLRLARERLQRRQPVTLIDVGTGSGVIAIAVAKHLPAVEVLASDLSDAALIIAGFNAKRLRVAGRVCFLPGDLLDAAHGQVDIVAANLPYVPTAVWATLAPEVRDFEPRQALDGGSDGLDVIRRLLAQLRTRVRLGGAAVLEIGYDQGAATRDLAAEIACVHCEILQDLAGKDRVAVLNL